jgi:peptide/nickel transport system ATP-binding protein
MSGGEIVEARIVQAVFAGPRHPYTSSPFATVPVPSCTTPGESLGAIPGTVHGVIGDFQGCAFRCNHTRATCAASVATHDRRCILAATPADAA